MAASRPSGAVSLARAFLIAISQTTIFRAYHVASYPTSFLIDGSGRIV
jgi:hypothetical protein